MSIWDGTNTHTHYATAKKALFRAEYSTMGKGNTEFYSGNLTTTSWW